MTDNKARSNNHCQLHNSSTQYNNYQQHPQQIDRKYQQQDHFSYQNYNLPSNQADPCEQQHDLDASPSPDDLIMSGQEHHRFCIFLWSTVIYEAIGFCYTSLVLFVLLFRYSFNIWSAIWMTQGLVQVIAVVSCCRLIKGLGVKEAKYFSQGREIFAALFIFECLYLIVYYIMALSYQVSVSELFYLLVCDVPAIAFAYIIWNCDKLEKLFGAGAIVYVVP